MPPHIRTGLIQVVLYPLVYIFIIFVFIKHWLEWVEIQGGERKMCVPFWCTAKILACVKADFSFLSCCFPQEPFRKVKWSTWAAKSPCDSPTWKEDTKTRGRSGCMTGQAGHTWWDPHSWAVPGLSCAPASALVLLGSASGDGASQLLSRAPVWAERIIIIIHLIIHCGRSCLSCWAPKQKCSYLCHYSDKNYFQLSVLLCSVYSGGVKAPVQPKWRSCLCPGCSALAAGCRDKNHESSSLFFSLLESTVAFGNACRQGAGRAVALVSLYTDLLFLPGYEV